MDELERPNQGSNVSNSASDLVFNINKENNSRKQIDRAIQLVRLSEFINKNTNTAKIQTDCLQNIIIEFEKERESSSKKVDNLIEKNKSKILEKDDARITVDESFVNRLSYEKGLRGIIINSFVGGNVPKNVRLPETIHGNTIIEIGKYALCKIPFQKIYMPNTILRINECAFKWCENLQEIQLPEGLCTLGAQCFSYTGLKRINIPRTVKKIERSTFLGCSNLKDVVLHEGLMYIGEYSFAGTAIQELIIPRSVLKVGQYILGENFQQRYNATLIFLGRNTRFEAISEKVTVCCYRGSVAEKIATDKNLKVIYIENFEETTHG